LSKWADALDAAGDFSQAITSLAFEPLWLSEGKKTGPAGPVFYYSLYAYAEKDDPQPQVLVAFGFLITNCAPSSPSE